MTELHKIAVIHTLYAALVGVAMWAWLRWVGEQSLFSTVVCALPVILCAALTFTSMADEEQYAVRLMACAGFVPVLLMMWAFNLEVPAPPQPMWPWGVGGALIHIAAFLGAVLWLGSATTRVEADASVTPVTAETLQARLLSLNTIGAPLTVSTQEGALEVRLHLADADRGHRVILNFNSETREVRVRERLGATGAAPATESERSMRKLGDSPFNPARPEASKISSRVAQTSVIKKDVLAAMPVTMEGRAVAMPPQAAATLDPDGMVTLLCRVVTRSGWTWAPGFFGDR